MKYLSLKSLLQAAFAAAMVPTAAWAVMSCEDSTTATGNGNPLDATVDTSMDGGAGDASTDGGEGDVWTDGGEDDASACGTDAAFDSDVFCHTLVAPPCDFVYDGGWLTSEECDSLCRGASSYGGCSVEDSGLIRCKHCPAGRRPDGFEVAAPVNAGSAFGAYFASIAQLEAASVDAFRILRRELVQHGAPRRLVRRAERSARDEIRHARITRKLARHAGAVTPGIHVTRSRAVRSLEAIALENAVEGVVRETFGALVAMWQATHATDARVAAAMKRIAIDETRHAELSWSVARWLRGRLRREAQVRIDAAMRDAIDQLACEIRSPVDAELVRRAGLPTPLDSARLVQAMRERVWAVA